MSIIQVNTTATTKESIISEYVLHEFGHFIVVSDDRIFINVIRRTLVTELGLPSNCMTIITSEEHIVKTIKEMSVRKKNLVILFQTIINNKRTDDIIKQICWKISNCKIIVITTESEIHHLALLREQKVADNWIIKPVITNQLVNKVASVIKPHGTLEKLIAGAEEFLNQGAFNHVLTICRKIFETRPNSAVTYMLMGDAYRGLDKREEMIAAYEHACHVDEMFMEPLHKLVAYFRERNDRKNELIYLEKLDAVSPLNTERKMEIAKLYLELGNGDDAKDTFESVMRMTTKSVMNALSDTATKIGYIYAQNNDPEAEKYFRRAIEVHGSHLDKSHMHLFNNLGILLRKNAKWKEAVAEYKKALAIDPESEVLYYNMALAYDDGDDFSNAYACIRDALRINQALYKNDSVVSTNIGMIFSKVNEFEEAKRYLEHALTLNPENKQAQTLLATLPARAAHS